MSATAVATKPFAKIGATRACQDHDRDLVHELDHKLDAIWRYDQYVANAKGHDDLEKFWKELKKQDEQNVRLLKGFIADEIKKECF
ncbi:MAG: hypothetical protein ACYTGC_06950 [Planctomycetota bacterium]